MSRPRSLQLRSMTIQITLCTFNSFQIFSDMISTMRQNTFHIWKLLSGNGRLIWIVMAPCRQRKLHAPSPPSAAHGFLMLYICMHVCIYVVYILYLFVFLHPHEQNFISQKQPVYDQEMKPVLDFGLSLPICAGLKIQEEQV